jgi:hypothetical protein
MDQSCGFFNFNFLKIIYKINLGKLYLHRVTTFAAPHLATRQVAFDAPHAAARQACHAG